MKLKLVEPSSGRTLESYQAVGKEAMVATLHKDASEVGLAVLKKGGNAVDAAIAVSFALSVLCPQWTGIGGGGFMLAYNKKDNKTVVFNFREFAPFKAKRDMYIRNGKADTELSQDGALAVAVPRLVAGLGDIYDHYASKKISWPELIQPAIQLAEGGFQVYPHLAYATKERQDVFHLPKFCARVPHLSRFCRKYIP